MNIATKLRELADEIESQDTPTIRPIGELPVGTEIELTGKPFARGDVTLVVESKGAASVFAISRDGKHSANRNRSCLVRVIAYPDGYRADGTPEPAALEQLPETHRKVIEWAIPKGSVGYELRRERVAQSAFDNAPEIFAAGEPVEELSVRTELGREFVLDEDGPNCVMFDTRNEVVGGVSVPLKDALAFARRTVAIALAARKNAQEDES